MKRIITAVFVSALIVCLCGCENPEKKEASTTTTVVTTTEQTVSETITQAAETTEQTSAETTTGKIGGFIIYDEAPGADVTWEDIGAEE